MAAQYIFTMKELSKAIGTKHLLKNIWLSFLPGAKIGILGLNGAGKTTLLNIMAGIDQEFTGEAYPAKGIRVGYLQQEPQLDNSKTVIENVREGAADIVALLEEFDAINEKLAEEMSDKEMDKILNRLNVVQDKIDACDAFDLDVKLERALDALRCPAPDSPVDKLSGGERRRVALCRVLMSAPDLLLLDEPTNHLDAESVAWLERHLKEFQGTVVAITHDRYFLDNAAGWILELDRGQGIPWEGNYSSWLDQKATRLSEEASKEASRQKILKQELEWIRLNPKGRRAKNKARIRAYEEMANRDVAEKVTESGIVIPPGPRLGNKVIVAKNLKKAYGDRVLMDDVNFELPPGAIVGVVGPNGAGKSTLFRMITEEEQPTSGSIELGETVKLAYVDQSRDALDPEKTIFEEISKGQDVMMFGNKEMPSRAWVGRFGFKGTAQQKIVGTLSGGERNRVHLAKTLSTGGNVILLDEPTNDLDVETLRLLEGALLDFAGCAVIITHDRWFLDRIATHILAYEDEGVVRLFEGGWQEYAEQRRKEIGEDAWLNPHRIKYKRIAI
jgi:ATP-binding cassette ChvD family protein